MGQTESTQNSNILGRNKSSDLAHEPTLRVSRNSNECGANMVEYALLAALVAIIAFAAVQQFGLSLSSQYSTITQKVDGG